MSVNDNNQKVLRDAVWAKAEAISRDNEEKGFRKDDCGAWIRYQDYGDRSSETNYGWEIDHIKPRSDGGSDDITNLRPLHWANNLAKSDNYPKWTPAIVSDGIKNRVL